MILVFLLLVFNCAAAYMEYRLRSPFFVFPLGLLFLFSLPHLSNVINTEYMANYSEFVYQFVSIWGCLFFGFYLVFRLGLSFFLRRLFGVRHGVSSGNMPASIFERNFLAGFLLVGGALFFASYGFSFNSIVSSNWADQRSFAGPIFLIASYLIYLGSGFSVYAFNFGKWRTRVLFMMMVVTLAAILKSRSYLVALIVPALVFFVYSRKMNSQRVVIGVLATSGVALIYVLTRAIRLSGSLGELSIYSLSQAMEGIDVFESNLIEIFYYYVNYSIDQGYQLSERNAGLLRALLMFIPGISGPRDISYVLWDVWTGVTGVNGSFHPTAVADSYINDRVLGYVIYPLFYATLFGVADIVLSKIKGFKISVFAVFSLVSLYFSRGAFNNGFAIMMVAIMFFLALNFLYFKGSREKL